MRRDAGSLGIGLAHSGVTLSVLLLIIGLIAPITNAATLVEARKMLAGGQYTECIAAATQAIPNALWEESWYILKMRAEMAIGQYDQALRTYQACVARNPEDVRIRVEAYSVLRLNGRVQEAEDQLRIARLLATRDPAQYASPLDRVALGRMLTFAGADARQVLELFYDAAKRQDPALADPHIASGDLALIKQDYAVAAESFQAAAKLTPEDPDIQLGLARSYENNAEAATAALNKALELNPRHVDSLLFQADNLIDREAYEQAEQILKAVLEINARHPSAWAYRAVMAHLAGNFEQEKTNRAEALKAWATNPDVDHLIGRKLSAKYRFSEGEAYQRQALAFEPSYQPARVQLCNDLLRLGKEQEGWKLAAEIFEKDPYNVVTYNLVTLRDHMAKFAVLENDHFIVRMDPREATIYGKRVLSLLETARTELTRKYAVELPQKITVEIFAEQKDFAIRTFGMPGGAGYLGVCFGNVVTANSPATWGATPHNWEAILWHEFCHVITLQKTRNRMPRWLSEGISVYEELARNSAWGQRMNPGYRKMILDGQATPVSKLSGAFLAPPSPQHLQFAYYESSLVIRYIVEKYGMESLQKVLTDLGEAIPINTALAKHTVAIEKLDEEFAAWLKEQAQKLAPGADLAQPELPLDADSAAMAKWNAEHPKNFWGLVSEGRALIAESKFEEAKKPLTAAAELYPDYDGPAGPYLLLATAHRSLAETDQERDMLQKHLAGDADAVEARLRLIELLTAAKDWKAVKDVADQVMAVNPLIPAPHRALASASAELQMRPVAIEAQRSLLLMDPLDRASNHYTLARLLLAENELKDARRQVVMALEQAPRYRDAHKLLLEIVDKMGDPPEITPPSGPVPATQPTVPPPPLLPN